VETRLAQRAEGMAGALVVSPAILDTLDPYASYLAGRKIRPRTRDVYRREVGAFARWIGDESTIADASALRVARYQATIGHLAAATIGKKLSAIRSWCRWCQRMRLRADDPTIDIEWPRRGRRIPRALKAEELRQLEAALDAPLPLLDLKARRIAARNRRIILLMLYAGLRRTEAAGLRWIDIDLAARTLLVRAETAKGGAERVIALHQRVIDDLEQTSPRRRHGAVAGHPDGRCLSHKTIGHIFEIWLRAAGLEHISAHRLRHTCATELLKAGASLRDIQQILGHTDIRTTEGYLDTLTEQQRQAIDRLPDRFG
jgi:site-specific recombinase XerD